MEARYMEEIRRRLLESYSVDERLEGLSPDQRLEGLSPEDVVQHMTPEELERLKTLLEKKT